jgi:hypothetical protein
MPQTALDQDHTETLSLDDRELRVALATAAYHARRIVHTMRLSGIDHEDAEQDIILTLLERRRLFDSRRGAWSAFADRVARQAAQTLADAIAVERRRHVEPLPSPSGSDIDADDPIELGAAGDGQPPAEFASMMLAVDVEHFVASLPGELRLVASLALDEDGDLAAAQRRSGLTTSEFYRRLREVRYRLVSLGLAPRRAIRARRPASREG